MVRAGSRVASQPVAGVRQADSDLRQALPEVALGRWCRLPRRLKDLMRVKGQALIQQLLGAGESLGRRQGSLIGGRHGTRGIPGQRSAKLISRPGVPGSARSVSVPAISTVTAVSPAGSVNHDGLAFRLWVGQPRPKFQVEALGHFLVREMAGSVQQAPAIRRLDVHAGPAGRVRQHARIEGTVQV